METQISLVTRGVFKILENVELGLIGRVKTTRNSKFQPQNKYTESMQGPPGDPYDLTV